MKYKYSILAGIGSLILGFIPISINQKDEITYTIYSSNIVKASNAKEELIEFYKNYCYSSLFINIDNKIKDNLHKLDFINIDEVILWQIILIRQLQIMVNIL